MMKQRVNIALGLLATGALLLVVSLLADMIWLMVVALVVMFVGFIYDRIMLRCPDCHKYVGKNEDDCKCCPRCGKILE